MEFWSYDALKCWGIMFGVVACLLRTKTSELGLHWIRRESCFSNTTLLVIEGTTYGTLLARHIVSKNKFGYHGRL
jgi:hypothetical protein